MFKTKFLLIYVSLVIGLNLQAQQQIVQHKQYELCFDQTLHEPVWVKWTLTPAMLPKDHLPRTNKFTSDPQVAHTNLNKDYEKSGYDQGHMMPAQDAASDEQAEMECFYFSNMEPQVPELNRVVWKNLEMWCRHEVTTTGKTLIIICGGIDFSGTLIGPDKVAVPKFCWKAIQEDGKWTAYKMPNTATVKTQEFTAYVVPIAELDKALGFSIEQLK